MQTDSTPLMISAHEKSLLPLVINQLILLHPNQQEAIRSVLRLRLVCKPFLHEMRHPHHPFWHALLVAASDRMECAISTLRCVIGLCRMQPALVRSDASIDRFNRLIARGVQLAPFLLRHKYDLKTAQSALSGDTALAHAIRHRAIRAVMDLAAPDWRPHDNPSVESALATLPEAFRLRTDRVTTTTVDLREIVRTIITQDDGGAVLRLQLTCLMDTHGDDVFYDAKRRRRGR